MKTKIEIGNFARRKSDGKIVKVALAKYGWIAYDENVLTAKSCPMEELEPCDPKTAFLTRLQELLAAFDAVINVGWNEGWQADDAEYPLIDMNVVFKDGTGICYDNVLDRTITAENVFDYDKD